MSAPAPRFVVAALDLFERDVTLRLPFRFGAATVQAAPQAFVRATIRDASGRESFGWTAEMMMPKWFDKHPDRTPAQNVDDLRAALDLARDAYASDATARSAFGHAAAHCDALMTEGARCGLNALTVSYGAALADRAIVDALCRAQRASFAAALRTNLIGLDAALAPDLAGFDVGAFLGRRALPASIAARHTIGLADPLDAGEVTSAPDDGLPVSLDRVVERYGHRHFKIKLSGAIDADLDRLERIARVLEGVPDYAVTLDGNEQFAGAADVRALWRAMRANAGLGRLVASTLYLEQPLPRGVTLDTDVHALADDVRLLIDESDDRYDAFPRAQRRGYRGVSSKNCKGPYKSLVNAMRCAVDPTQGLFVSAEDLTTQCGLAVQQDLALAALLGCTHVERNGHHYVAGFAGQRAGSAEQAAFAAAHPGLYAHGGGGYRLAIRDGRIALDSLDVPGFASGALPDPRDLAPLARPRTATLTGALP